MPSLTIFKKLRGENRTIFNKFEFSYEFGLSWLGGMINGFICTKFPSVLITPFLLLKIVQPRRYYFLFIFKSLTSTSLTLRIINVAATPYLLQLDFVVAQIHDTKLNWTRAIPSDENNSLRIENIY